MYFTNLSPDWKPISEQGADLGYPKFNVQGLKAGLKIENSLNNSIDIDINNK